MSREPIPLDELRAQVDAYEWFHSIDLGHGLRTRGRDDSPRKLEWLSLPADLSGRSVLDIGAWDGFFSFEAERRGAKRVLAVDSLAWRDPPWGPRGYGTKQGFELARRALGSEVEDLDLDFDRISPDTVGMHDLVLFLGVLYHMQHPWLTLQRVASVCRDQLILETHVDLLDLRRPAMAFYAGDELSGDESNWWGPNPSAIEGMLRAEGFTRFEVVHLERRAYRYGRALYRRMRGPRFLAQQGRCVIHAWR